MRASQIAAALEGLHREFQNGNIGWRNYKESIDKIFNLDIALAERVAALEDPPVGIDEPKT